MVDVLLLNLFYFFLLQKQTTQKEKRVKLLERMSGLLPSFFYFFLPTKPEEKPEKPEKEKKAKLVLRQKMFLRMGDEWSRNFFLIDVVLVLF